MNIDRDVLHKLLETGVKHGASDIHFRPGAPPMYRVHGELVPLKSAKLVPAVTESVALLVAERQLDETTVRELDELDTSYSLPGVARFRVNIYRQRGSLALVLRIIPSELPSLEKMGMPPVLADIAMTERGLVLVTGATGSGKTTTLAAMLDVINEQRASHILTIEDPIEFLHPNKLASVSQRELGLDTRSYITGMRSALRQDPDVILVGEMRDAESIDIALKAAETGHVVFSTVHTTDAVKTINRIVSVFPAEEQKAARLRLAESLAATISQRLLPRADRAGMVAACEIMICTGSARDAIADPSQGALTDIIEKGAQQYGMQSFDQHLVALFRSKVITKETALRASSNPSDFERNLSFT
ncbi:MAG: type IV pili twitching motility protein PilT [Deltaproteobacteria bacterium]|nr:MAG: type IV pili twitching motility protein PilT [Deltaproteobacteria bacterium]